MEPIKFEDNIREKLQEREIAPSKTSWEKLATQIDTTSQKRINKSWFAIAAGFIGVIIIVSFIVKDEIIPIQNTLKIVSEPIQTEILNPLENNNNIVVVKDKQINEKTSKTIAKKGINNNQSKINKETIDTNKDLVLNTNEATFKESNDIIEDTILTEINGEELFLNAKVNEVVAQVQALNENNNSVTAQEIDALLLAAQKEIQSQKIVANKKVDATALLDVVESEMETTFRDKVFEALGDGFEKVRTAVVERNN